MKIGILGGGQLARMLALAAYPLGIHTVCYEPLAHTSASFVTDLITAPYDDEKKLRLFAEQVDVITYETENIPLQTATFLNQLRPICPSLKALTHSQDRLLEKNLFVSLGIETPKFIPIHHFSELEQATVSLGFPALLKTRRMGYDGKGQCLLKNNNDLMDAREKLANHPLLLEEFITFDRELSLIAVRGKNNEIQFYPLVENKHHQGILRLSLAPYDDLKLQQQAENYAKKLLDELDYTGVLVIEFFQVGNKLLANEIAPRVHNSGHWTIEGAQTSQFENHIRAICNLPLGNAETRGFSAMINCIGNEPTIADILKIPSTHFHTYEKTAQPNRKLGHITVNTEVEKKRQDYLRQLEKFLNF